MTLGVPSTTVKTPTMKLYHYTSEFHLVNGIMPSGHIGRTDSILSETVSEPKVAWFMNHPNPRLVRGNRMLASAVDKTQIRITVDVTDGLRWFAWASEQEGFDPEWAKVMNSVASWTMRNWWITTRPVNVDEFVAVEVWDGKRYVPRKGGDT